MSKLFLLLLLLTFSLLADTWTYRINTNQMTGETSYFAISPNTQSTRPMNFPYHNTSTEIGIVCTKGKQVIFFNFNNQPNLVNTTTENGYNNISTRIKIDNHLERIKLRQKWGDRVLYVKDNYYGYGNNLGIDKFVENITKAKSLLFELDWHGNPNTYFKYSLKGSSKAIHKMQQACGYKSRMSPVN